MSNLQEFLGFVQGQSYQLTKPFLYEVTLSPTNVRGVNPEMMIDVTDKKNVTFLCHSATLPGFEIASSTNKIYGLQYEIPYEVMQSPVNFSFYVDKDYKIPNLFLKMKNQMFDSFVGSNSSTSLPSFSPNYKQDYMFEAQITVYDISNRDIEVAVFKLHNAFLKNVSQIDLNYSGLSQIVSMSISLVYETIEHHIFNQSGANVGPPDINNMLNKNYALPVNLDTVQQLNPGLSGLYQQAFKGYNSIKDNIVSAASSLPVSIPGIMDGAGISTSNLGSRLPTEDNIKSIIDSSSSTFNSFAPDP